MFSIKNRLVASYLGLMVSVAPLGVALVAAPAAASEIKYVVNDIPVTTYDIQRRAAFLKLQNKKGGSASEELVTQALRSAEVKRLGITITDDKVNEAYARFASSNKMSLKQMDGVLAQSGVTKSHFKEFIRSQMGWNQAMSVRYRSESGGGTQQDAVRRMLREGGAKPSATEYMLQQVIFVVPQAERKSSLGKRKREAEAMRARFSGCDTTQQFAKGLLDVTVRNLGRKLAPELPTEWAEQIKETKAGGATGVRETERGVEFIGVCSSREVSDDRVAQLVFRGEDETDEKSEALAEKYIAELREKARIIER